MNKKIYIVFVLTLFSLLVIVVFLNIKQNVLYNESSFAVFLSRGHANEVDMYTLQSSSNSSYKNIKPRKSKFGASSSGTLGLATPLNNQSRMNGRSTNRSSYAVANNLVSANQSPLGISYNQANSLTSSNEGIGSGSGFLGYSGKSAGASSGGGGGGGLGMSNGGLLASQSSFGSQTSLLAPPTYGGGPLIMDPGGDPLPAEMIPVGDGLGLLLIFGLFYAVWRFYLGKNN